jgi:hypothetical protein
MGSRNSALKPALRLRRKIEKDPARPQFITERAPAVCSPLTST